MSNAQEVHLAIYDLSQGMARNLSAQLLGPQHAVEIIPHTALLAFGKEYFFGQGITWCAPHEFRMTRGIHPIEIQSLGHTTCTEVEFEAWCRSQATHGGFSPTDYDLLTRNCNNFSEVAAKQGLRLQRGVPEWILELPQKFMSSPMGMMLRPMLEQMQITNNAPTNLPSGGGIMSQPTLTPTASTSDVNPWANILTDATSTPSPTKQTSCKATPLLDKQTSLLSTDTGVVKICIDRLKPEQEQSVLLSKLADTKAKWTEEEINSVHQYLNSVIVNDVQHLSYALMLLRLVVLKQPIDGEGTSSTTQTTHQTVTNLLFDNKQTKTVRSMVWCVLSNAIGSNVPPLNFIEVIDQALSDCDSSKDVPLRQSASAYLYNSSRYLTIKNDIGDEGSDLSEGMMSILLGCLEHLQEEFDVTTSERIYMSLGQFMKSSKYGETAISLVKDLGLYDGDIATGKTKEVQGLAREVAVLLG